MTAYTNPPPSGGPVARWWARQSPITRTALTVVGGVLVGLFLCLLFSCRPPERKPAPDSTVTDTSETAVDSGLTAEADTMGILPEANPEALDSVLSASVKRRAVPNVGLAYGLTNYDLARWCSGPFTGTMLQITPDNALRVLQAAAKCGIRIVAVPSRPMITTTGRVHSPFSPAKANQFCDDLSRVLTPSVLDTYRGRVLIGMNLADDYGSPPQWGGQIVTQAQIAAWAAYCGSKMPTLPMGIRVEPSWANQQLVQSGVRWAWCQWRIPKGKPQDYADKCASQAKALGLRVVMTVNVQECNRSGSGPCSAAVLREAGTVMVRHPYNCADIGWKLTDESWRLQSAVHQDLLGMAKARPWVTCS